MGSLEGKPKPDACPLLHASSPLDCEQPPCASQRPSDSWAITTAPRPPPRRIAASAAARAASHSSDLHRSPSLGT